MKYTIGEFAKITGISPYTLRFYEKKGLLLAKRAQSGHRYYLETDLRWVEFIKRLKETGMPLKEIKDYVNLRAKGKQSLSARRDMLQIHREHIITEISKWQHHLHNMNEKIEFYNREIAQYEKDSI